MKTIDLTLPKARLRGRSLVRAPEKTAEVRPKGRFADISLDAIRATLDTVRAEAPAMETVRQKSAVLVRADELEAARVKRDAQLDAARAAEAALAQESAAARQLQLDADIAAARERASEATQAAVRTRALEAARAAERTAVMDLKLQHADYGLESVRKSIEERLNGFGYACKVSVVSANGMPCIYLQSTSGAGRPLTADWAALGHKGPPPPAETLAMHEDARVRMLFGVLGHADAIDAADGSGRLGKGIRPRHLQFLMDEGPGANGKREASLVGNLFGGAGGTKSPLMRVTTSLS